MSEGKKVIVVTVGFLRNCGEDKKCASCGKLYRAAMEQTSPHRLCGKCFLVAFPSSLVGFQS